MIEKCKVRKVIFSEVSSFLPATLWKNEPFTGLFQRSYLDFEWVLSSFDIQWAPSRLEGAVRYYGKVLKN